MIGKEINFIEMKQSDIKSLKEKIWLQNNKKCPVLDVERPLDKMALDHIHANKTDEYSIDKGTIRTALDFRVNAVLGKLENSIRRTGLDKEEYFNIGDFLRKAADYFDNEPYHEDNNYFIHPNEVKKEDIMHAKEVITSKIKETDYTFVITGKDANKENKFHEDIGYRNWQNFEIAVSKASNKKLAGIKLDKKFESPEEIVGCGVKSAMSFTKEAILKALKDA
jgi:hypothetical protein